MIVWPFIPRTPVTERMQWVTDVIQARTQEQRISLREQPRVWIEMEHELTDQQYQIARSITRDFLQFYVPFWPECVDFSEASVNALAISCSYFSSCDKVLLWRNWNEYEVLDVVSASPTSITFVTPSIASGLLVPLFLADVPDGMRGTRRPGAPQQVRISVLLRGASQPPGGNPVDTYLGHEIITECPKLGSGGTGNPISYNVDSFEDNIGLPEYSKRENYPEALYSWKWLAPNDLCPLRQFMARLRGQQQAFWVSDYLFNYVPVGDVSGTDLYIEDQGYIGERFHIEIVTKNVIHRRKVTNVVSDPLGLKLELDSGVTVSKDDIVRISRLVLVRLRSDEIVFDYIAGLGTVCSTVLMECPEFSE